MFLFDLCFYYYNIQKCIRERKKMVKNFKLIALTIIFTLTFNLIGVASSTENEKDNKISIYSEKYEDIQLYYHEHLSDEKIQIEKGIDLEEQEKIQEMLEKYIDVIDVCSEVEKGYFIHLKDCECDEYIWDRKEEEEIAYNHFKTSDKENQSTTRGDYPYCCTPYHSTCGPYKYFTNTYSTVDYHYPNQSTCYREFYAVYKCSHCGRTSSVYEFSVGFLCPCVYMSP